MLNIRSNLAVAAVALLVAACSATPTRESTGEYFDDAAITAKVKAALIEDKQVKSADVTVDTYRGQVQLSGFADDQAEIDRAGDVARRVPGVTLVRNDLVIKPARQ